ncbi:MAG TPA: SDR family NAD(P)-dependent oxidoreductase [Chitinophagales bacterium]|nr:SDR family NAD(P)-dependent oxidoreductase [Chitinophagales bacterium]
MNKALILGAKSDIAKAIAVELAGQQVNLLLAARNCDDLKEFKHKLENEYAVSIELREFDALKFNTHAGFVDSLPESIDTVFCVFGYLGNQQLAETDTAERELIWNTNYTGAESVLEHIAIKFNRQGRGLIVGVSSVAGDRIRASNRFYGESKAAFAAYLNRLRKNVSPGVQVLVVKPGFVDTKMTAHLKLPPLITASATQVARAISKAIVDKETEIYVLPVWRYIMFAITLIPESLFKYLKL